VAVAEYVILVPSAGAYEGAAYDLQVRPKEAEFADPPRKRGDPSLVPLSEPTTFGRGIESQVAEQGLHSIGHGIYLRPSPPPLSAPVSPIPPARDADRGANLGRQEAVLPPLLQQAFDAFENDLPHLLKSHRGQWVVYRGAERLAFGTSKTMLLQACYARGYPDEDLYVRSVEESPPLHLAW